MSHQQYGIRVFCDACKSGVVTRIPENSSPNNFEQLTERKDIENAMIIDKCSKCGRQIGISPKRLILNSKSLIVPQGIIPFANPPNINEFREAMPCILLYPKYFAVNCEFIGIDPVAKKLIEYL